MLAAIATNVITSMPYAHVTWENYPPNSPSLLTGRTVVGSPAAELLATDLTVAARAGLALMTIDLQAVLVFTLLAEEIPPVGYARAAACNGGFKDISGCRFNLLPFFRGNVAGRSPRVY